jgi:hypothetical protein
MKPIQLPETYIALSDFRKKDIYLPEMNQDQIISDFFPETFKELTQRLSDITGAFMVAFSNRQENSMDQKLLSSSPVLLCMISDQEWP